jgi:hypothetical protein
LIGLVAPPEFLIGLVFVAAGLHGPGGARSRPIVLARLSNLAGGALLMAEAAAHAFAWLGAAR